MLRDCAGVGYALRMSRPGVSAAALTLLCVFGCQPEQQEQAKQAVEQGVDQAKQQAKQGVDQAKQQAKQGVAQAKQGVEVAKQEIAEARERYEVDERLAEARARFGTGMDEAADDFAELAASGRERAEEVGDAIDEGRKAGIEGAAEAIECAADPAKPQTRRCKIQNDLLDRLKSEPKLIAREIMLLPRQGETGQGLELVTVRERSVAELLGLDRKDILLELNGVTLDSLDVIRRLDEALANKHFAEIIYERAGERKTLVLERK